MGWFAWNYLVGQVTILLYLGAASQAARLFIEARRSGLLELLLVHARSRLARLCAASGGLAAAVWMAAGAVPGDHMGGCRDVPASHVEPLAATVPATTGAARPALATVTNAGTLPNVVVTTNSTTTHVTVLGAAAPPVTVVG